MLPSAAGEGLPEQELGPAQALRASTGVDSPSHKAVRPSEPQTKGSPWRSSVGLGSVMDYGCSKGLWRPWHTPAGNRWGRCEASAGPVALAEEKGQASAGSLRGGICSGVHSLLVQVFVKKQPQKSCRESWPGCWGLTGFQGRPGSFQTRGRHHAIPSSSWAIWPPNGAS